MGKRIQLPSRGYCICDEKLDEAGIFALNQPRAQVYINVELMPPDDTDIQRALSFNNLEHIKEWLSIFG